MLKDKIIDVEGKYVAVRAAEPFNNQVIDPVIITISGHYPTTTKEDIDRLQQQFKIDAWKIFDGLRSLPGGTFDQLLILMLQKSASSFIVPHDFHDEESRAVGELAESCQRLREIIRDNFSIDGESWQGIKQYQNEVDQALVAIRKARREREGVNNG